jgi:hypothetical protein
MNMCVFYARLIIFTTITLDNRIVYFTSAATLRQLLELLKEIK